MYTQGMVKRQLQVWFNDTLLGTLEESNNLWAFEYDEAWQGISLSPQFPTNTRRVEDGGSIRPVQWFFDNLLPEEGARELLAKDAKVDKADAFGLLGYFGAESAGALTLLAVGEYPSEPETRQLPHEELEQRIRNLPKVSLSTGASKRMSMAGAQHKLPVILDGDRFQEPIGGTPSRHILKPDHNDTETYPHTAANEWFCMELASRVGLDVPTVHLIRVPSPVYVVDRFDRDYENDQCLRKHALDGCQLLNIDRIFKYRECTTASLNALIDLTRQKAATRQLIFKWLVFNLVIGNNDNHLKNLSFFPNPQNDKYDLTPHYDLISTTVYDEPARWEETELVWPIADARTYGQLTMDELVSMAKSLGLAERFARRTVETLLDACTTQAEVLLAECEQSFTPGEMRLLRMIRYSPIEEFRRKLFN